MSAIFQEIDKIRPAYDMTCRTVLLLCKLLPVVDVFIATMTMAGRYIPFIPDPAWGEEVVLTCMSYMVVLSAALVIGRGTHIRITVFDRYLPPKPVRSLDIVANLVVPALVAIMITVGWKYAIGIGAKGTYVSIPRVSRFWIYFPVPLTEMAMLVFRAEVLYNHARSFFVKGGIE